MRHSASSETSASVASRSARPGEVAPRNARHLDWRVRRSAVIACASLPGARSSRAAIDFGSSGPSSARRALKACGWRSRTPSTKSLTRTTRASVLAAASAARRRDRRARGHARKALFERRRKIDGALQYHGGIEDAGTSGMIPLASSGAENRAYCRAARNADTIVRMSVLPRRRLRARALVSRALSALLCCGLAACVTPRVQTALTEPQEPRLEQDTAVMEDGARLPLRAWLPAMPPRAAIVAVHGLNDYSGAFESTGEFLAARGFAVYAFDQRGFGRTAQNGIWAGGDRMADDAWQVARLLRLRHPGVPFYGLGESMGGAVLAACAATPSAGLDRRRCVDRAGRLEPQRDASLPTAPAARARAQLARAHAVRGHHRPEAVRRSRDVAPVARGSVGPPQDARGRALGARRPHGRRDARPRDARSAGARSLRGA